MGALSKLDEFLPNPQVRTCSVAAHGTSRNSNSENRETHGDRSSNDPCPGVGYFPHHSGQLKSPEAETISHRVTEIYPYMVTGATRETRHYPHRCTSKKVVLEFNKGPTDEAVRLLFIHHLALLKIFIMRFHLEQITN